MLACIWPLRSLLSLQDVTNKEPLVCGKTFPTPEEIEKNVTVFDEYRPENLGCCCNREVAGVLLGCVTSAMIEHNCGKGTGPRRLPKKGLQAKTTARYLNSLRSN